jgi:Na+-transporting NADH:ubiquinone oxidoreductase subunit NqrD
LEKGAVKDAAELLEELEGVLDVGDVVEVLINVALQVLLDMGDFKVKLDVVFVEESVEVVKQLVVLLLELLDSLVEAFHYGLDALKVVLLKHFELLDGLEQFL